MIEYSFALHSLHSPAEHITVKATVQSGGLSATILIYIPDSLGQNATISHSQSVNISPRLKRSLIQRGKTFLNRKETLAAIRRW